MLLASPPLPKTLQFLFTGLALALLLARWLRLSRRENPSERARTEEVQCYRNLLNEAGGLLEQGRLTDAREKIDGSLREIRREARRKERSRHIPSQVRQEVWERDEGACLRCGAEEDLQFDHIIPWSLGGSHSPENMELLCGTCNREKAARVE
jgi:5-methylcytosine-specific restriction endonuclease McrA